MNDEAGSGRGLPLQRTADGLQALTHASQAVAFGTVGTAAVVADFQRTEIVFSLQPHAALLRLRMTHNVGDGLTQRKS